MSNADQTNLFRKISDDVLENTTKFSQQSVDDAFALKLTQNSDGVIAAALKANKLPATSQNVAKIKEIVQKALVANGEKSVIPISSLHQRIAIALGGAQGSNKIANIASHLLEEGLMFAAVETPMEIFQSMNEEREMDLTGRAAHAFALGNALGLIRFMPCGKTWIGADGKQSSISREAFRKVRKMVSGKRPYRDLDTGNEKTGSQLVLMAKSMWDNMGQAAPGFFSNSLKGFRTKGVKKDLKLVLR